MKEKIKEMACCKYKKNMKDKMMVALAKKLQSKGEDDEEEDDDMEELDVLQQIKETVSKKYAKK